MQSELNMTSIKAQSSPPNAVRYFREHLTRDDYYSDQHRTPGFWYGRACEALGIDCNAEVTQADFVSLCNGLRPDDGTRLTQRAKLNRRCLYDVTFSAPKSVSVMAILAADERIIAAHDRAVAVVLEAAEKLAAVRVRRGDAVDTRRSRATGNIVCARFSHSESRALDPQLHTHCIVFNVTHDALEGKLKALEARPIYDHATHLTRLYRQHLNQSLHALGYGTHRDRHGCVQIRGVSPEIMGRFSKRAAQRDVLVALREKELGRPLNGSEVSHLIHEHRGKKQRHIEPGALRKMQLDQLSPVERLQLEHVKALALAGPRPRTPRSFIPRIQQGFITGTGSNWLPLLRVALRLSRAFEVDPFLFSPNASFPRQASVAAQFVRQVRRTKAVLRYFERSRQHSLSR